MLSKNVNKTFIAYVCVTLALLVGAEVILYLHQIFNFSGNMLHLPNEKKVRDPKEAFEGIRGKSVYTTNALGLRGKLSSKTGKFIIVFGNSTTECVWLDDKETWAQLTMNYLNKKQTQHHFNFNIAATSGIRVRHNFLQLKSLLDKNVSFNLAIFLCGVRFRKNYKKLTPKEEANAFFNKIVAWQSFPPKAKDTFIYGYWRQVSRTISRGVKSEFRISSKQGDKLKIERYREFYKKADKQDILTAGDHEILDSMIEDYQNGVRNFVKLCQKHNIKVLLLTKPVMYKPDMPQEYIDRFVLRRGSQALSPRLYHKIAGIFARCTRQIAKEMKVHCIDLHGSMSSDLNCYYDRQHFNEYGAQRVSKIIGEYIISNKVLN